MAPERLENRRGDARSDQFSFCVALWEAIFGQRPFSATTELGLWEAITEREPEMSAVVVGIPARLVAALRRGLAPRPDDRFADMVELVDELEDGLAEPERRRRRRRARITVVASVLTGLALGAVLTMLVSSEGRHDQVSPNTSSPAPPFADSNQVAMAFSEWQAKEPDMPSLEFADAGTMLAMDMERSADLFRRSGDRESAVSTLMLTEIALRVTAQHQSGLGLLDAEYETRTRLVDVLRALELLSSVDQSEKIDALEARLVEIRRSDQNSGSPP